MKNIIEFPNQERIEEEACRWILRLDERALTDNEVVELNEWVKQSERHKQVLLDLSASWSDMDLLSVLAVSTQDTVENKRPSQRKLSKTRWYYSAAASVMLFIGAVLSWQSYQAVQYSPEEATLTSEIGQTEQYELADGSQVWLNTQTKVETHYEREARQLTLVEGEAHFAVEKDADRPFEVSAGRYLVRAIGTAFSVRLIDDQVQVVVTEGVVEIIDTLEELNFVPQRLKAGEATVVDPAPMAKAVLTTLAEVDLERKLSWREGRLIFDGEPLQTVVSEVSRYTPINIDIATDALKQKRIGGQFSTGKTEELFEALEHGFGLKVTWLDDVHVKIHEPEKK